MSRGLLSFFLACLMLPLAALNIGKISFHTPDHDDPQAVLKASGLSIGTLYEPETVTTAIQRLYDYYHLQGRYFVRIDPPELIPLNAEELELSFTISEPVLSDQAQVQFDGNSYLSDDKLRQLLVMGKDKSFRLQELNHLMEEILSIYQERGYLFVSVQLDSLVLHPTPLAYIGINEGKPLKVKNYLVQGNKITKPKTLIKLSGLNQLKIITPAALEQARENLLQKSYISDCSIEPMDPSNLLIRVKESRMTYLEGLMGVSNQDSKTRLTGQFRLQFMNLWGSDRAIMLYFKQVPKSTRILNLSYHDPGISPVPIAADIDLNRVEQDSTWISTKGAISLSYQMLRQAFGITLQTESLTPGTRYPATVTSTQANGVSAFWNMSRLEGGMNPRKGMGFNVRYGVVNNRGEGNAFTTAELGVFGCLPVLRRWVGYANVQARNINNPAAEAWQQYKMGGYGSLRGYHEDEFSSFRLGWTNYELRYLMTAESRVYLFCDQGFIARNEHSINSELFGIGGGLKVKTKLGILGLEYALGYRDKRFSRIGLGMIHAGLSTNL